MPPGGGGRPAGGYRAGKKGSYGCKGFPTVSADGTVHGCHPTKARAQAQARAIWASTSAKKLTDSVSKSMVSEGDFVVFMGDEDKMKVGRVEYVMENFGTLGLEGSEYALEYMEDDKPIIVRLYEEEDGAWEEEQYLCYHRMSEVIKIESIMVAKDIIVEMTATPMGIEETPVTKSMYRVMTNHPNCTDNFAVVDEDGELEGCFSTREEANMFAEANNKEEQMENENESMDMDKSAMANAPYQDDTATKAKPNYGEMIQPRRGGSTPSNPRLYARVVQEAKDRFDVYPSAVANGWVVQEYKRRGGTYKMYDEETNKREFSSATRERMAEAGTAMPDGSFPIANRADLQNAIQAVGRARDYTAARAHIIRRARALNAMEMLPEDWRNKATKGMTEWSGSIFDLNPFVK